MYPRRAIIIKYKNVPYSLLKNKKDKIVPNVSPPTGKTKKQTKKLAADTCILLESNN